MAQGIAINGFNLHEVHMPMEPYANGCTASLRYPPSQIRFAREEGVIRLAIPAYLAAELYREGILPAHETKLPVEVRIGGRPAGWFVVADVRYPHWNDGPFHCVHFTLSRVPRAAAREAGETSRAPPDETGAYVMDITHYLDGDGELMPLPGPARKLASFLTLLIEAATAGFPACDHDSRIRCRRKACLGHIRTSLASPEDEISWHCPVCRHHGVIRSWQQTKWNQLQG